MEESFLDGFYGNLSKFVVLKHFGSDGLHKQTAVHVLFTIYFLKSVFCEDNLVEYNMSLIDVYNFKWKHSGRWQKHALETRSQISPRFSAPGERFAAEFVIMKHFAWESFLVGLSCSLDIAVYMLKDMFCWHIPPLNAVFKWASTSWCQQYHPLAAAQLLTPKKTEKLSEANLWLRHALRAGEVISRRGTVPRWLPVLA